MTILNQNRYTTRNPPSDGPIGLFPRDLSILLPIVTASLVPRKVGLDESERSHGVTKRVERGVDAGVWHVMSWERQLGDQQRGGRTAEMSLGETGDIGKVVLIVLGIMYR
jgi:hypothetical protein